VNLQRTVWVSFNFAIPNKYEMMRMKISKLKATIKIRLPLYSAVYTQVIYPERESGNESHKDDNHFYYCSK